MVFDLLTLEDKQKILSYRDEYGSGNHGTSCDIDTLLAPWNSAKSQYLESIFKDQLIVTRPIEFNESYCEIRDKMETILFQDNRILDFMHKIKSIYAQQAKDAQANHRGTDWWELPECHYNDFVCSLFYIDILSRNKISSYEFQTKPVFELLIGDNICKIHKDAKPMRIIAKIANAYGVGVTPDENGITDFEYFRRKHSLGLNQKTLKGNLCLSIHPLDYMTMSDNEEGWESCMNWRYDGEYKQGTVEMMNSPCVVVGYLASNNHKLQWADEEWNSKKWRSLFIVDKDFIINVRSYPYDNDNLVKAALTELAELSGWGKVEAQKYEYLEKYAEHRQIKNPVILNNRKIAIDFRTQAMYNDFGWGHYIALNPKDAHDIINYQYYYSGTPECVWCGTTNVDLVGADYDVMSLQCKDCNGTARCQWCDDYTDVDDIYTTADGVKMCEYCWHEHTAEDKVTELYYCADNSDLCDIILSKNCIEFNNSWAESITTHLENFGTEAWTKYFKIPSPRIFNCTNEWGRESQVFYLLVEDCTPLGLELFGLYTEDDIQNYLINDKDI